MRCEITVLNALWELLGSSIFNCEQRPITHQRKGQEVLDCSRYLKWHCRKIVRNNCEIASSVLAAMVKIDTNHCYPYHLQANVTYTLLMTAVFMIVIAYCKPQPVELTNANEMAMDIHKSLQ